MGAGGGSPGPQLRHEGLELSLCGLVAAGHPGQEAAEGLGEAAGAGVGLAGREPDPLHVRAAQL